jgi:signal transduction histidine kinase
MTVDVEGVTATGKLTPYVTARPREQLSISIAEENEIPPAARSVSLAQLATPDLHGDFVEVDGVVRNVRLESVGAASLEALVVTLAAGRERLEAACIPWPGGRNVPVNWVGATLRIRGVFNSAAFERQSAAATMRLLFSGLKDLRVLDAATQPFELPIAAVPALKSPDEPLPTRARVQGTVTLPVPGKGMYLQAGAAGLWVDAPVTTSRPGDRVDAVGFPTRRNGALALEDVAFKSDKPAPGDLPDAPLITPEQALAGDYDARLVRMEALVLEVSRLSEGPTLVLQSGERVFLARLANPLAGPAIDSMTQESFVRVTGVCVHNHLPDRGAAANQPVSFHLLLGTPNALEVVRAPSWWTLQRTLAVFGVLTLAALAASAWVVLLRVRVARQTALIRDHLARETLYEERVRIARDLHDSLEQDLLGISMQLNATDKLLTQPDRARESLQLASAMVRRSQAETHRAVWDLREKRLGEDGLVSTLCEAVTGLQPAGGTQIKVQVTGDARPLAPKLENHLLRVALEAVTNALKHARAATITIDLAYTDANVTLQVKDDGQGFDATKLPPLSSGHFGLFGMRERAEKVNGQLTIQSQPDGGSSISLTVPTGAHR